MKDLKEYLRKNSNGTYSYIGTVQPENISQNVIEIPEGSNIAVIEDSKVRFYSKYTSADLDHLGKDLIWMRPSHPEELPFIDDEPKITTAKGSELDYIAKIHDMRDRYNGESDEDYRYQLEHYISRKEPSLNDQYAEIEQVRQQTIEATLAERQAQYGCFEDVARTTGKIMEALSEVRVNGLNDLPHPHRMALYMIASKMARIVNGNPNHKDSRHDIAVYATLIDNELVSEKDMPF